jgi:hypothetical protein
MAAPENLSEGVDAVSQDFKQIVYRQKQLGFNSIRCVFVQRILVQPSAVPLYSAPMKMDDAVKI